MSNEAFYYVDGVTTKGTWVDLDLVDDTDEVLQELARLGLVPTNEDGEPEYGGDLLVADVTGDLPQAFYSSGIDSLDLSGLKDCMADCDSQGWDYEAAAAYIGWAGSWSRSGFEDAYNGEWDSEQAFAENLFDECYLHEVPDFAKNYIDYEKFARDLFRGGDYTYENGYVFRCC
jgi:hypothetical protein